MAVAKRGPVKVALCQINTTIGAFEKNVDLILAAATEAAGQGAELAVFPELAVCGYPPLDLLDRPSFVEACHRATARLVAEAPLPIVVGTIGESRPGPGRPLTNDALFVGPGFSPVRRAKQLLPTYDVFDEDRYFERAGERGPEAKAPVAGPRGARLGLSVCEDAWAQVTSQFAGGPEGADPTGEKRYGHDPVAALAAAGADLLINISASPFHAGKQATRRALLEAHARTLKKPVVCVNLVGANEQLVFDGGSLVFNAHGQLVAELPRFAEAVVTVDLEAASPLAAPSHDPMAELHAALTLGIRDYFAKTGFTRAVLGLSGGIDSALVAELAVSALGAENVTGVSMPSRYSSQGSKDDAALLAKNLGIAYLTVPIEAPFSGFQAALSPAIGAEWGAFTDAADATEENIQSRCRGTILMAIANRRRALVLSTGNKSEHATGYATLYGDMAGALSPIADVYKTEVWALSRWINRHGEVIPWNSITKAPSAELRPDQTDQDSLPPYDVLDAILQLHIEGQHSHGEIVARGYDRSVVADVLRRVAHNEYKRRQAAFGLKVSPKAFGMGRRIPLARQPDELKAP